MYPSIYRQARAEINLNHLQHNVNELKNFIGPTTKYMSVIKADAYGHGAPKVAQFLENYHLADYFAVALIGEALELRAQGVKLPILMFTPIDEEEETLKEAITQQITLTVFTPKLAQKIVQYANELKQVAKVHLKIDSGMGRVGVKTWEQALTVLDILDDNYIYVEGVYTHFADADNMTDDSYTHQQFKCFNDLVLSLENRGWDFPLKHCANTAATINFPEYHLDMVRVGIGTYGYYPDISMKDTCNLQPVMAVKTPVHFVKQATGHDLIGYGSTYQAEPGEKIATLAIGYADGVPRHLSNQWEVTIGDKKAPIVGRVCMDQLMINVDQFSMQELEKYPAVLFGDYQAGEPSLYKLAELTCRFHYELLCNIHKRLPRVYLNE